MYVDDTSLAYSAKNVNGLTNVMNYELKVLENGCIVITLHDKNNGEPLKTNFRIS